jgi:DNA mismatch repair protein MutS
MAGKELNSTKAKARQRATTERRSAPEHVPSRQQYLDLKHQHPDAILLFRLGDFYETFDEDARLVARDARITLTTKNFGRSGRVPMAGIPHHALNHYLGRLLAAGHTLAIAEQMSEPGRGLVDRAITRVLSPGTVGEASLLPAGENRYLAAVLPGNGRAGVAWVDVSTGEFATMEVESSDLGDELARLNPAECLLPDDITDLAEAGRSHVRRLERWHFAADRAMDRLCRQFGTRTLQSFGCDGQALAIGAAGSLVAFLERTNPALLPLLRRLRTESSGSLVGIDAATRRNLELTRGLRTNGTRGSLLGVLDLTRTAMGARALRRMVGQPIRDLDELRRRQAIVAALVADARSRASLSTELAAIGDLERLVSRVTQGLAGARDFLTLRSALRRVPRMVDSLSLSAADSLAGLAAVLDPCTDVAELIESTVEEHEDGSSGIRLGCHQGLDDALGRVRGTRSWLASLERAERERTGIRSLKVGFNKVFGYYIEVTRPNLALVPDDYVRKQTIATGERYITAPLKEAESRVLAADDEIAALERAVLADLGLKVTAAASRLIEMAGTLARLDALLALAEVAVRCAWVAPQLDQSEELEIVGGRHPVVEGSLAGEPFIDNDCRLGAADKRVLLLTGPNMGGKSTFLRQTALIVLLAQIGSFVPAKAARIGLVDRIFTRVGAHDDLAGGASTFMVEMIETATILNQATSRSLVILDEVGRGTSTYDGLAIARAVLEDLHNRVGARTLFATHYLELTQLADDLDHLINAHVTVLEAGGRVIFLYAVRPGSADRAYGIHVARLAGLPPSVADRAEVVLHDLDHPLPAIDRSDYASECADTYRRVAEEGEYSYQLTLNGFVAGLTGPEMIARELRALDLETVTPGQAIDWLYRQKARLEGGQHGI